MFRTLSSLGLGLLLLTPAHAQDDEESSDGGGLFGMGDVEIDLGGPSSSKGGGNEASYEGLVERQAADFAPGKPVTITHTGGNITVRCTDRVGIHARVAYTIYGTNRDNMKRMGDGVGVSAWGSASSGGVKTKTPYTSSGVRQADIDLTVTLPEEAQITVIGGNGWIQVSDCKGTVKAGNKKNGAYVSGTYSRIDVGSGSGDVTVELEKGSELTGTNKIAAPGGKVKLALPMTYGGKFYAKGSSVSVAHTVMGTNEGGMVSGTISTGTASLSISASEEVSVVLPD